MECRLVAEFFFAETVLGILGSDDPKLSADGVGHLPIAAARIKRMLQKPRVSRLRVTLRVFEVDPSFRAMETASFPAHV